MPPQDEINLSSLAWHKGFSWYSPYLRTSLQSPPFPVSSIWSVILPHSSHSQHCLAPGPLHLLIPFHGTPLCPTPPYSSYNAQSRNPFREAFQSTLPLVRVSLFRAAISIICNHRWPFSCCMLLVDLLVCCSQESIIHLKKGLFLCLQIPSAWCRVWVIGSTPQMLLNECELFNSYDERIMICVS